MSQERYALNKQLAQMLKGGVIMDVTTPEQAKIAEEVPVRLWRWRGFRQIFVQQVVFPG